MKVFEIYPGTDAFVNQQGVYFTHLSIIAKDANEAVENAARLGLSTDGITFSHTAEELNKHLACDPVYKRDF